MESRNPVLSRRDAFRRLDPSVERLEEMYQAPAYAPERPLQRRMTIDDVVVRSALTLGTLVAVGAVAWWLDLGVGFAILGLIGGFVLAMVIAFKRVTNPAVILAYAGLQGLVLGVISHYFETRFQGIVVQAVLGTVLAFGAMLGVYATRIIRVTPKFTKVVVGMGGALVLLMLVNLVSYLFLPSGIGIRTDSTLGILFSLVAIGVGCLFLMLDFDMIERGIQAGAPERESWLAAFGLTVTLVWIYLETLRLLSYLRGD